MTRKQKRKLRRIIIALVLFILTILCDKLLPVILSDRFPYGLTSVISPPPVGWLLPFGLYFAIFIYIGYDVLKKAFLNLIHGQMLDENFLMCIATIGAFGLGIFTSIYTEGTEVEGFDEACAVLLFYQFGEWLQTYAVGKSRKSVTNLMQIRPDYANRIGPDDSVIQTDPESIEIGETIRILAGEKVPLDGVVLKGNSSLDTRALTGESVPREVETGDAILSGSVNMQGTLDVRVTRPFSESTVNRILQLVENASNLKSKSENLISKFARIYTPCVVIAALLIAVVPSLIVAIGGNASQVPGWIYRALSFLVVSCPCALVISVPLSFFSGIGGASRRGILVKGSSYLEILDAADTFVFDKTGTLTTGSLKISGVFPEDRREEILRYASLAESQSMHPIARSIVSEYPTVDATGYRLENISGMGVKVSGDHEILCGNAKLMNRFGITPESDNDGETVVYVALDGAFLGEIRFSDEIKDSARQAISELTQMNCHTTMLTGDTERAASRAARELGLSDYKASLLPEDKVASVEAMLKSKNRKGAVCFVGDGINDAPVLMRSDIGIAMGGIGSDAAIEASDIVLMHDDLRDLVVAKKIAKKTVRIAYENIWFALGVKILILILAAFGIAGMWLAVFGDVGVAMIAILNAMRAGRIGQKSTS